MQQTLQPAGAICLRDVLPDSRIVGGTEIRATSCCSDSRQCRPGDVFVALTGARYDGHDFVDEAVRAGASAIVSERLLPVRVPVCIVDDTRQAYGRICQSLVGCPSQSMRVVGVTGTHGKTTTSVLIQAILREAGHFAGHMTTLENSDGLERRAASTQSPEAPVLARWLARMWANGCTHAVTEFSSAALAQRKPTGVSLDAAVFTNIGSDHLDLHLNVQNYRAAKCRLLDHLKPEGFVVLNADDPASEKLLDEIGHPVLTVGMRNPAELTANVIERYPSEQTFLLHAGNESVAVRTRMIGDHHVYNCLCAAAVGLVMGIDISTVVRGIESVERIPGRMEQIDCGQPFGVFVDEARTPGSLSACLKALRRVTPGRVICVYGPDGRRPRELRPQLGTVVERGADFGIITSNNPCHDEPLQITHDVLDGYDRPGSAQVLPSRQRAIEWALGNARRGDTVLIAGKGADTFQIIGSKKRSFDDREVARTWLYARGTKPTVTPPRDRPRLRIAPHTI